jgi:hypothetical protein
LPPQYSRPSTPRRTGKLHGAVILLYFQFAMWAAGLLVQSLVISSLLRFGWRQFPLLLLYVLLLFCTTLTDIAAFMTIREKRLWSMYYWTAELIRQSAMYAVVVSMGIRVIPDKHSRPALIRLAFGSALLLYASCLALLYSPDMNEWMTAVVRNISFASAVLNVAVWMYTIPVQHRDPTALMITGGLGIQITGEAIGQSLRQLFPDQWLAGNLLIVGTHFVCMLIWRQALQRTRPTQVA